MKIRNIDIDYIARVEGEGSVKLDISNGDLRDLKLNIWEPPRFFEGFLVGRKFDEVPDIVARICGICPVSHMTTAIRAVEKAIGFEPSEQISRIREIMALSQIMGSHIVHLYVLALPDYRHSKVITGMRTEVARLLRMKEAVNSITAAFGGRALHPIAMVAGGFTKLPERQKIGELIKGLQSLREDAQETLKMISSLDFPDLESSAEFVALSGNGGQFNRGLISSELGIEVPEDEYASVFEESQIPYANAKRTLVRGRGALMVGALARFNLNFGNLHHDAHEAADTIGFEPPARNPYLNNLAQAVEIIHCLSTSIELLDGISGKDHLGYPSPREGSGGAVTEAPRGLLYHEYHVNRRGVVERANIVTPTAHNFLGLEENLRKLVRKNIHLPEEELVLRCEMLVRAYDPCFSCSVH